MGFFPVSGKSAGEAGFSLPPSPGMLDEKQAVFRAEMLLFRFSAVLKNGWNSYTFESSYRFDDRICLFKATGKSNIRTFNALRIRKECLSAQRPIINDAFFWEPDFTWLKKVGISEKTETVFLCFECRTGI